MRTVAQTVPFITMTCGMADGAHGGSGSDAAVHLSIVGSSPVDVEGKTPAELAQQLEAVLYGARVAHRMVQELADRRGALEDRVVELTFELKRARAEHAALCERAGVRAEDCAGKVREAERFLEGVLELMGPVLGTDSLAQKRLAKALDALREAGRVVADLQMDLSGAPSFAPAADDVAAPGEPAVRDEPDEKPWRVAVSDKKASRKVRGWIEEATGKRINWRGKQRQGILNSDVAMVLGAIFMFETDYPALVEQAQVFIDRDLVDEQAEFLIKRRSNVGPRDELATPLETLIDIGKRYIFLTAISSTGSNSTG